VKRYQYKNSLYLYLRQFFLVFVNLLSVTAILNALGVIDYALYTTILAAVTLLSFLPSAIGSTSQRNLSFEIGIGNIKSIQKIININLMTYCVIALTSLAIITISLIIINTVLVESFTSIKGKQILIFGVSISFFCTIANSFSISILIATQKISTYAKFSIFEALLKLFPPVCVYFIQNMKIEIFSMVLICVSCFSSFLYMKAAIKSSNYFKLNKSYWTLNHLVGTLNFSGWTIFGQLTTMLRKNGILLVFGWFYDPVVVASRAIAQSVANQFIMVAGNIGQSVSPSLVMDYSQGNSINMQSTAITASKVIFILSWILFVPFLIVGHHIYELWLIKPPAYLGVFAQIMIIESLITAIAYPVMTIARAPGIVGKYEFVLGIMQMILFSLVLLMSQHHMQPSNILLMGLFFTVMAFFVRLKFASILAGLNILEYVKNALLPMFLVIIPTIIGFYAFSEMGFYSLFHGVIGVLLIWIINITLFIFIALSHHERHEIVSILKGAKNDQINT
jgi:O-antigen/teichoic acid export membrane protein